MIGASYQLAGESVHVATIYLHDPVRDGMAEHIRCLATARVMVACLSGDRSETVQALAQQLQLDWAEGDCSPQDKATRINELEGPTIMVGDGLNDTLACRQLMPAS